MARGITESDVHGSADEIVAAGERPTVERIRAHLGTGSPNTVTRWLDTWWKSLGDRLLTQQGRLAVPNAPETVATLAGEWWALALEHAREIAEQALVADRSTLKEQDRALQQDRAAFAIESEALREEVSAANHAQQLAMAQATELQRLVLRLEEQLKETTRQRDVALTRVVEADAARQALDLRIQELQDAAQAERSGLAQHVQAVEERAHAEIDRARLEAKDLQIRLAAAAKENAADEKLLRQAAEHARAIAAEASRDAGSQRARADALEAQLAKLQDLPAALEAAMRRSDTHPKPRKSTSKRIARKIGKNRLEND